MTIKNFPETFVVQCQKNADKSAFYYCDASSGEWKHITWREYQQKVEKLSGWLKKQGVTKGSRVALLSTNRPEWMISDLAVLSLGGVSVPIYATSSSKDICYIAGHSGAKIFLVDSLERAQVLASCDVEQILVFDSAAESSFGGAPVTNLSDVMTSDIQPESCIKGILDDDMATLIYTSGTTGLPKGVVHSHNNFKEAMGPVMKVIAKNAVDDERFFSFLPLSHVAERVLVQLGSVYSGSEVAFARSVSNLAEDLVHCRPTILLCVPRLWEKMHEKINSQLTRAPKIKQLVFALARRLGSVRFRGDQAETRFNKHPLAKLSDKLVGEALRKKLGLDRARMLLTGSAPTRPEVMKFFASFGLFIREVYGLTENLCLGVYTSDEKIVIGSCGKPFEGNEVRIAEDGEIQFKAPWIFDGYLDNEVATKEVFSDDGWFLTGDLGRLDDDGYLRIVGRKKELLKTSTGKYVAPVPIEDLLKALPLISDAMVVGDNQKYCIALVCLDDENRQQNEVDSITAHIGAVNKELANHESIKRVGILKAGFSVEAGTLTPSLKLKRKVATDFYGDFIERVYVASEIVIAEG